MGIYVCSENYRQPITADVMIEGVKVTMEIDSGASRTIISEDTYNKLWSIPPSLNATNIKLVTWTRETLKVLGEVNVHVKLGAKEARCDLIVVSGKGPSFLGRNWFHGLNIEIVGLCWSEDKITNLVNQFPGLFASELGEYKGPLVSLHVRADATPKFLKARAIPFPLKQQVNEELNKMVDQGILTPVNYSNWATPLRIVKKDDGSLRICGDYRATVNAAIDVDSFPLPKAVEAFVKLSGGRVFSKLDLKQAYTQLKVDDKTAMLLTLNTPIGLMKMNRLAFGVNAAPAIFQRVMSTAFADKEGVACLLDDIAIMGRNEEEHEQRLYEVLHKLHDMGFRLNVSKCIFAAESITFLGHMIDANGLHPAPAKVKEIREKPAPTNKETLRAFLGLYNFYEKFLPDKATLLEPLYRLLDSKRPWNWGEPEQIAFDTAKNLLSSELTLVGYELDRELLLICDSSDYGLGANIAHVMDDGSERPIMMASRTLQKHERCYGQIDKEALAIIFGLSKFHEYLAGRKFSIITDHKSLVGLFNPDKPIPEQISPRMLRWSLKLSCYQYIIKYRAGKLIGNADALSRWLPTASVEEAPLKDVLLLDETPDGWNLDANKVASETKKDPDLRKVMFNMLHGWPRSNSDPTLQPFWQRKEALSHRIVQTKAYARGYVWWYGMDKEIERLVSGCHQCQAVRNNPPRDPQTWVVSEKPWKRVHIDFAGPFQGEKWKRAVVEMVEGPRSYLVRTEDGVLQRRHVDQILARSVEATRQNNEPQDRTMPPVSLSPRSNSDSLQTDEPIEIPPPELWPDIIGIPNTTE
ncbi:uncharacterized protein K02A2.6-like [Vanessa cardui]|uniref:uncharacterized protein K02A2.6-like n=1 Tax=Vanessa cardui TaxID=171605 RepID=UPI001F12BDD9|nr:uncharacterized protein K02A2.6-like [Vanessa cardui]